MGGIARENGMKALAMGGTKDHVHALLSLSATMSVAKAIQLIKGGSSKWVHDQLPKYRNFAWQDGYGAFSVSASQMKSVIRLHRRKERTSSEEVFRGRVFGIPRQAWSRVRSALRFSMIQPSASRTAETFLRGSQRLNRWAIFTSSASRTQHATLPKAESLCYLLPLKNPSLFSPVEASALINEELTEKLWLRLTEMATDT